MACLKGVESGVDVKFIDKVCPRACIGCNCGEPGASVCSFFSLFCRSSKGIKRPGTPAAFDEAGAIACASPGRMGVG